MAELKALCMKCRQKGKEHQMQVMKDLKVQEKEGKGGNIKYSAKGVCSVCGTGMFKFLSKDDAEAIKKEA
jgi:hypothetical protein